VRSWSRRASAQIGIKTTINKIPGANWRAELLKKEMPLITNFFSGWLDYPEYFFFWCYHGQNAVFNTMSYQNPEMDALIDRGAHRRRRGPQAAYETDVKGFIDHGVRGRPAHPAVPALPQRRDAETSRATATGSTASSTTAAWSRREGEGSSPTSIRKGNHHDPGRRCARSGNASPRRCRA
jgi:hypothetical protein